MKKVISNTICCEPKRHTHKWCVLSHAHNAGGVRNTHCVCMHACMFVNQNAYNNGSALMVMIHNL